MGAGCACPAFPEGIHVIAVIALLLAASGARLAPGPVEPAEIDAVPPAGTVPASPTRGLPPVAAVTGAAAAAAGVAAARKRRDAAAAPGDALGLEPPDDVVVVLVPGHGNGPEVFDGLVDNMGLETDEVAYFDYRWAVGGGSPYEAARAADADSAADALNGFISGLTHDGTKAFVVGFSKGGTTVADLISDWDRGGDGPAESVVGAVMLDPPMAAGAHGWVQSLGTALKDLFRFFVPPLPGALPGGWLDRIAGFIPTDGGYDPVRCTVPGFGCRDARERLGEASGVSTLVVRNPKGPVTNFSDLPEGLRVYDAPHDGPGALDVPPWQIPAASSRAHLAVLGDPAVADCLLAEMERTGSCGLDPAGHRPVIRSAGTGRPPGPLAL